MLASRLATALTWLQAGASPTPREVARQLGNGIAAADSCVTAIYLAARFMTAPFEDLLHFVARVGGDVDTIGAMAGGIWGASHGVTQLPAAQLQRLEQHERLMQLAAAVHAALQAGAHFHLHTAEPR
jgi:ADP-ribosylglycohydrolase